MAGNVIEAIELLTAVGNKINGSAMPVNTPYVRNALFVSMPKARSCTGMDTASMLCKIFRSIRLAVNGTDKAVNSFKEDKNMEGVA